METEVDDRQDHPDAAGGLPPAGWYPDPQGLPRHRYWDGQRWTDHFTATKLDERGVGARADQQHRWVSEGDLRGIYGEEGAEMMRAFIEPTRRPIGASAKVAQVVHTDVDLTAMMEERPPLWPGTAFVSVLIQRRDAVISRLREVKLGFVDPEGVDWSSEVAKYLLGARVHEFVKIVDQVADLIKSSAFQTMLGENSDDEADADVIVLAASRLMDYHEQVLSLAEENREMNVPLDMSRLQRLVGKALVDILGAFDGLIEGTIARLAKLEDALRFGSLRVEDEAIMFSFRVDDELVQVMGKLF